MKNNIWVQIDKDCMGGMQITGMQNYWNIAKGKKILNEIPAFQKLNSFFGNTKHEQGSVGLQ